MSSTGDTTAAGGVCPPAAARAARPSPAPSPGPVAAPDAEAPAADPAEVGYRGPAVCAAAGITYRQLDYWDRTGLVEPTVRTPRAAGALRLYGFRDVLILRIVKRLLDAGVSLQNIRLAVRHLRSCRDADLPRLTLMCDGATVYEVCSPDDVVELLQGGSGVFGIAVGAVWREVGAALGRLPGESPETGDAVLREEPEDELARARRRRNRAG